MSEDKFQHIKNCMLQHIQTTFEELEESLVMAHQEKYALLEDVFENANDVDELKIAFEQWHRDHADEMQLEESADELWESGRVLADEEAEDMDADDMDEDEELEDEESIE